MKMKTLVAIVALGALAVGPAFAQAPSRHHAFHGQSSSTFHLNRSNPYESDAQGYQPYPNPDREPYRRDTTPPD
jgi:hypothetical protein